MDENEKKDLAEAPAAPEKDHKVRRVILRTLLCVFTAIVIIAAGALGGLAILTLGPSQTARDLFVVSMNETSMGIVFAKIFLPDEKINEILEANTIVPTDEDVDPNLVDADADKDAEPIVIEEVSGSTYKGKVMLIADPSRVKVAVRGEFSEEVRGKTVEQMVKDYNAVAGINGGWFYDPDGLGKGGLPVGLVISGGKLLYGNLGTTYEVIGFDNNNVLYTGYMTGKQALDRGIRDAVCFGPSLIVNGEPITVKGLGSGLNPRSAIGQRADGTVILCVLEGRKASSLGATLNDVISVMLRYGAVNAANLDGGTSSVLYYNGEYIVESCAIGSPRGIPDAFIVV
ncbi:MAG: phosphodiester glycosidase family protein [Clostridia bacterium]|nr:phosphodiester glycosidase family protein [Clostridia bacterium]